MSPMDLSGVAWRKSSHSSNGDCVEVARAGEGLVGVRDSGDRGGPVLTVTMAEWGVFLQRIKDDSVAV